jgi:F0F1-type ATP synthase membrane subunit b/b'
MEINVTIVLQTLQFVSVYYFLYKFLFAPASQILDEDEAFKNKLYKNLEHEQQIKDSLQEDYQAKNTVFKHKLMQDIPQQATQLVHEKSIFGSTLYIVENNELSPQDREKTEAFLVDRLSQVIKK